MIKSKDVNVEVNALEDKVKSKVVELADVLKGICLAIKLLRDIRTNQVTDLKARNIALISPDEVEGRKTEVK